MSNPFFDHPILNSPYERPPKHWELDEQGQPHRRLSRGAAGWFALCLPTKTHYDEPMIITLPDDPALAAMGEAEIRLDLACGAYAAGHVSRGVAARMAGLNRHAFDQVLVERRIPSYDEERLAEDRDTMRALRPS